MRVSLFTPAHHAQYLPDLWKSLERQTYQDFERIILFNNWGDRPDAPKDDRIKIHYDTCQWWNKKFIGRLKSECCKRCTWDIFFEMDYDDELEPTALEETVKAFEDPEVVFAFSNSVNVNFKENWWHISGRTWNSYFWWMFRKYIWRNTEVYEAISADPEPQNISRIYFAPNHLRAYRATTYKEIWWYDESLEISDDHDIWLRMYLAGKVKHINKPLYIYKVSGDNTWLKYIEEIKTTMWMCYDKYIVPMMKKRSKNKWLKCIDLWWAIGKAEWYLSVDRHNADIVTDLNGKRDIEDNSVWLVRAHDVFEHLSNPIHTMNELWRVMCHGGIAEISVPSDCGIMVNNKYFAPYWASCDPTHVSRWNIRSWKYYTEPVMRKYIEPECICKFTVIKPAIEILQRGIPYTKITVMAEKWGKRYYWENLWRPVPDVEEWCFLAK